MPTSTLAPVQTPFVVARGDTWTLQVTYVDPAGAPINLTGSTVTGELYLAHNPLPIVLTGANGGLTIDATRGAMAFSVPPDTTVSAPLDPAPNAVPAAYAYPNRLHVLIQDTLGRLETKGILPILVYDARSVPIGSVPPSQVGIITAAGAQGPAGPASYRTYRIAIAAVGQTLLPWPNGTPKDLSDVGLLVDGREYRPPFLTSAATGLTWGGPFDLEPADDVLVRY